MENKLGKAIGIVTHTCKVTNSSDVAVQITVKIDFSSATDSDIKAWLVSNRIIAGQRPWRSLSESELVALGGTTFVAQSIGQKVRSKAEQIAQFKAAFVSAGVSEGKATELAQAAVDNPQLLTVNNNVEEDEED